MNSDWKRLPCWWVVFCDTPVGRWSWRRLLRRGYRHCLALGFDPERGVWVIVDPCEEGLAVRPVSESAVDTLTAWAWQSGGRVLRVTARRVPCGAVWPGCAGTVGRVVGACAVTPYGLCRRLIATGAQEITP